MNLETAADLAERNGHVEILELLAEYHAFPALERNEMVKSREISSNYSSASSGSGGPPPPRPPKRFGSGLRAVLPTAPPPDFDTPPPDYHNCASAPPPLPPKSFRRPVDIDFEEDDEFSEDD